MANDRLAADFDSLMEAATELLPLLDRSLSRLRYGQGVPGLSPLELRIMDFVCHHQPVRIGAISDMSGLSFPNASRYVKDLVSKGYLLVGPDAADRRSRAVSLSGSGSRILVAVEDGIREKALPIFMTLDPEESRALSSACRALGSALEPLIRSLER